jgi:hypothetical protein
MSQPIDDGGPAFPVPPDSGFIDGHEGWRSIPSRGGMSLRAWFAGQALAGLLADKNTGRFADVASDAIAFADEVIAKLKRTD